MTPPDPALPRRFGAPVADGPSRVVRRWVAKRLAALLPAIGPGPIARRGITGVAAALFPAIRPRPAACLGAAGLLAMLLATPAGAQDRPTVVAVNYPLAYFAERLAGEAAEVVLPVPEGSDPQFWRPGVAEIGAVQAADLILLNGAGFAGWTERASLPRARTVDTSRAFADALIATEAVTHAHGPDGEHSHEGTAAFTWLDLDQAALQAEAVAAALARLLPEEAGAVEGRLEALRADLAALDGAAGGLAERAEGRTLIASHPRYQYLARAYDLAIESVEWEAGAAPDEAQLAELERLVGELDASVFLWEASPPAEAREAVRALGLEEVVLPTQAAPPEGGDFVSIMRQGLAELAEALARAPIEG